MKNKVNTELMAVLFLAFKQEVDSMNESEGLTIFTELEQITQDCIMHDMEERQQEIWE